MTLTILGEEIVGSTYDKLVDKSDESLELLFTSQLLLVRGIKISAFENGVLIILAEFEPGAQNARIGKVQQRKVFSQVILHRRSSEEDTAFDVDRVEGFVSTVLGILESVSLVCQKKPDRCLSDFFD